MSAARLRLGLVGAGTIARTWSEALRSASELELVGIADTDEAVRQEAAAVLGQPAYASVRELCAAAALDAAIVATPPAAHEPVAVELLAKGIAVLCEKPLATSAIAASRMLQAAARAGVPLLPAAKFRYVPAVREARRLLEEGALGEPILCDLAFCAPLDMTGRWNSDPAISGGGVLIDNGCHALDVVRYLLGPIVRVFAHFGRRAQAMRVEDTVRLLAETQGACLAAIDLSWSLSKASEHWLSVQGTGGTLQIGWQGSRWRTHADSGWRGFGAGYDKVAAFRAQLDDFAAVIRRHAEPQVTGEDGVSALRAIEAAYRAARVSRWIPLGY